MNTLNASNNYSGVHKLRKNKFEDAHGASQQQVCAVQRAIRFPNSHPHYSESSHCQHNKTHHTQHHMKHSPIVQFKTFSNHVLENSYFMHPEDTTRIN